jgi:O-antigen ligase
MIQPRGDRFRWFPPLTITYGIFLFFVAVSWMFTPGDLSVPNEATQMYVGRGVEFYDHFETSLYPLFEVSKLLRGGIVYLMMVNFINDEKALKTVLASLLLVIAIITLEALKDRYISGYHRISSTLGHPNSLGTFMAMMGTLMFGLTLYRPTFLASGIFGGATAACLVSVLLTISRGALAAFVMGIWIDVSSLLHRFLNLKNIVILIVGGFLALALFFTAADTITTRFLGEQDAVSDIQYRGLYNEEARMMASDHFFGVGMGNFSAYSWIEYGRAVNLNEYGTQAHNLWFLVLGELGYPGLLAFTVYWLRCASIGIPFLFRRRTSMIYAAAAAASAALLIGHVQFMLQLSYRQTSIFMLNKMLLGIVVACWYIDRDIRKKERLARRAARNQLTAVS